MAGTLTITAPTGPGDTATGLVFSSFRTLTLDPNAASLLVIGSTGREHTFDLKATTTITATASSGVFTVTISQ